MSHLLRARCFGGRDTGPSVLSWVLTVAIGLQITPAHGQTDTTQAWRSDFRSFVLALRSCAAANCSFDEAFGDAEIAWEGVFVSWDEARGVKVDMGLGDETLTAAGQSGRFDCCTMPAIERSEFKTLVPGSRIRFQASISKGPSAVTIAHGSAWVQIGNASVIPPQLPQIPRPRIRGRVLTANGQPSEGVSVSGSYGFTKTRENGLFDIPIQRVAAEIPAAITVWAEPANADDPLARLLYGDTVAVAVGVPPSDFINLVLGPKAVLEVTVRDEGGKPVKDADVTLWSLTVDGKMATAAPRLQGPRTDKNGYARLVGPPGDAVLQAARWNGRRRDLQGQASVKVVGNQGHKVNITVSNHVGPITFGDTFARVEAALGKAISVSRNSVAGNYEYWLYEKYSVTFRDGRVAEVSNRP